MDDHPFTSNTSEFKAILDLSSFIGLDANADEFEECFSSEYFQLAGLTWYLLMFPLGEDLSPEHRPNEDEFSIHLQLEPVVGVHVSDRNVSVATKFENSYRTLSKTLHDFDDPICIASNIMDDLRINPKVEITIRISDNAINASLVYPKPNQTFEDQNQKLFELTQLIGDTILLVKVEQTQNELEYAQPNKKRKLNNGKENSYQCEVCNRQFDSAKSLKSHQSNKRDAAHKKFKNNSKSVSNPNNANHKGLDESQLQIKVNAAILRAASNVFDGMLTANMREKQENKIIIHAKSLKDVRDLVYFMCTNKMLSDANPANLIQLAHLYQMDRLFWECVKTLVQNVTIDNFVATVCIFNKYEIEQGFQTVVDFGKRNVKCIQKKDNFTQLPYSFRCIVLEVRN